ncbi:DNA primase [Candidatus Blochmanniella vafra]|uniref:DNA primase n=1 Tax=Candidatus Blochmanniella vafra TaxID=251535 RepID=UPI002A4E254C|nr:DNA primase [Candidatus Blochmannia vafer]
MKKKGSNFIACCPFHSEKYPSFTVNFKKQFYYCFSCGAHGNIINFLMNYDQYTFIECIKKLSTIHGISIKNFFYHNTTSQISHENNLYKFMSDVSNYYQNNLINKKYAYAHKYLQNRGLTTNSIANFNIGFAPMGWNNIAQNLNLNTYNSKLITQSGIYVENGKKNKYDRFRERIIFPMKNQEGKIIGFGGRTIQHNPKQPKYLNSPDTTIFKKNQYLYGFYETCKKHKNIPYILLVEGYMDVIILTQFGINYVVSTLGTSMSVYHIRLIYSVTNQIICCYDGDNAGKKAAWRTLNTVLPYLTDNKEISFMFLPNQEDPDTLIRKIGKDSFLKQISKAQSLSNFLFETLSKKINLHTLEGRVKLSSLILPMINQIPGQILQLCLQQKLSKIIGILDDSKLQQLLKKPKKNIPLTQYKHNITYNIEHILIGLLIQNPKLAKLVPTIQGLETLKHNNIKIFINLVKLCKFYPNFTTEQLLEYFYNKKTTNRHYFIILKKLAYWKHIIKDDMIIITFIDTLTKLYNLILEQQQNMLITRERLFGLTNKERRELWMLNQKLSSIHILK